MALRFVTSPPTLVPDCLLSAPSFVAWNRVPTAAPVPWDGWTGPVRTHFGHVWAVLFVDRQEPLNIPPCL